MEFSEGDRDCRNSQILDKFQMFYPSGKRVRNTKKATTKSIFFFQIRNSAKLRDF